MNNKSDPCISLFHSIVIVLVSNFGSDSLMNLINLPMGNLAFRYTLQRPKLGLLPYNELGLQKKILKSSNLAKHSRFLHCKLTFVDGLKRS